MNENEIGTIVLNIAFELHRNLGPGIYERVYEAILAKKLQCLGLRVERQVPVPIQYDGLCFDEGFRADLIVDDKVMLELKSVEVLHPSSKKQLLTYLKLKGVKLGYVINFGEIFLKDGIFRIVNGLDCTD